MARPLEIVTPENVILRYELAGFGSRGLALAVDLCVQVLLYLVVFIVVGVRVFPLWDELEQMKQSLLITFLILAFFVINWGYHILFETLWNGETPGKRWMGLRVIKDGGYPVDFRAVLVRNLVRAVDFLPILYGLAFIVMLANAQYKRLGDMAGGTLVVRHRRPDEEEKKVDFGQAVAFRLLDLAVISQISRLTKDEYRIIHQFLSRAGELPPDTREVFAQRLAQPFMERFGYVPPALGMQYERWLEEVDLAYRNYTSGVMKLPEKAPEPAGAPVENTATSPVETRKW